MCHAKNLSYRRQIFISRISGIYRQTRFKTWVETFHYYSSAQPLFFYRRTASNFRVQTLLLTFKHWSMVWSASVPPALKLRFPNNHCDILGFRFPECDKRPRDCVLLVLISQKEILTKRQPASIIVFSRSYGSTVQSSWKVSNSTVFALWANSDHATNAAER
jgi:hypothetical protein